MAALLLLHKNIFLCRLKQLVLGGNSLEKELLGQRRVLAEEISLWFKAQKYHASYNHMVHPWYTKVPSQIYGSVVVFASEFNFENIFYRIVTMQLMFYYEIDNLIWTFDFKSLNTTLWLKYWKFYELCSRKYIQLVRDYIILKAIFRILFMV